MLSIKQRIRCACTGALVALIALSAGAARAVPITHAFDGTVTCWGDCAPDGTQITGILHGTYTFDSDATAIGSFDAYDTLLQRYVVQMRWQFGTVVAEGSGEIWIGDDGNYDGFLADFYFGEGPGVYFYAIDCTASMFDSAAPPINLELKLGGYLPGCSVGEGFHMYNPLEPLPGLYFEGVGSLASVIRVSEPGALALLAFALAGLGFARYRKP